VHCAARASLSTSAASRHCGRGPPVSPSAPPLFGRPRDVPRRAARVHCGQAAAGRFRAAALSHAVPWAPSLFPIPTLHAATTPGPPLLCLAASASKSRPTLSCLPLLFYHSLSSVHGQATHLSSMPATEPPRPLPACF
jgi:hypothetical protein